MAGTKATKQFGAEASERAADEILRSAHGRRRDGIYSEVALQRKMRLERARLIEVEDVGVTQEVLEYLLLARLREVLRVRWLSQRERAAVILSAAGWTRAAAAERLGVGLKRYWQLLSSAQKKVERWQSDPYAGWYEVYLAEVNRYVYRRRRAGTDSGRFVSV